MKKAEVYSKPSQLIKVESFPKMAIRWKPLTIFAKNSILDVWLGSEYASIFSRTFSFHKTAGEEGG